MMMTILFKVMAMAISDAKTWTTLRVQAFLASAKLRNALPLNICNANPLNKRLPIRLSFFKLA